MPVARPSDWEGRLWPWVPSSGGDSPAPGCGPGSRAVRLPVGTGITVALRGAPRTGETPRPGSWSAAGWPTAGHLFGPVDVAVPGAGTADYWRPQHESTPAPDGRRPADRQYPRVPGPCPPCVRTVKTGLVDSDADRLLVAARVAGYRTPRVLRDAELEQLKEGRSTWPPSRRRTDPGPGDKWLARRYTGRELTQTGPGIVLL